MKALAAELQKKVQKHEEKLKAHHESKAILISECEYLKEKNDLEKLDRTGEKLLSTLKNIEYHNGKKSAYEKVLAMIEA